MEIVKLTDKNSAVFARVCRWSYDWWGRDTGLSMEEVAYILEHSIHEDRLPQTFVALLGGEPAGMYQLSMSDDLRSRPDIYPWLANVYVDEKFRGKQVCRAMMNTVCENAAKVGLKGVYLYTHHVGLYEKFGWKFVEKVPTFKKDSPWEGLYRMEIR